MDGLIAFSIIPVLRPKLLALPSNQIKSYNASLIDPCCTWNGIFSSFSFAMSSGSGSGSSWLMLQRPKGDITCDPPCHPSWALYCWGGSNTSPGLHHFSQALHTWFPMPHCIIIITTLQLLLLQNKSTTTIAASKQTNKQICNTSSWRMLIFIQSGLAVVVMWQVALENAHLCEASDSCLAVAHLHSTVLTSDVGGC